MNNWMKNGLILAGIVLLTFLPLFLVSGDFGGADDKAEGMILEIDPQYKPWAKNLSDLPSETESMLFALQAAIGAGVCAYTIGWYRGKSRKTPT